MQFRIIRKSHFNEWLFSCLKGGAKMMLKKPKQIEQNEYKSSKWDELVAGRNFSERDIPTLCLLCGWYAVMERCLSDLDFGDELPQVAYQNDLGDLKAMPQLSVMKQASAEIRAINKQLGIEEDYTVTPVKETKLHVIQNRRAKRQATAAA